MTKLFFLCRRRGDLTHDEYVERLLGGHVPLALAHHPMLRRYVVNVVEGTRGPAPPVDSIGTLWFDSLADYRERLYDSPAGARAIADDVAGFLGRADAYATTEHVQRAPADPPSLGRTPGVKLLVALGRAPGQTREDFLRHWLERHVPLALEHHGMSRYVTSVVEERLGADAPPYSPGRPSTTRGPRGFAWCRPARTRAVTSRGTARRRRSDGRRHEVALKDGSRSGPRARRRPSQHSTERRRHRRLGELLDIAPVVEQDTERRPAPEFLA